MKFERLAFDSNAAIALLRAERLTPPPFAEAANLVMPLFVLAELELGVSRQRTKDALQQLVDVCTIIAPDRETISHYVTARNEMLRGHTLPSTAEAREGLLHDTWIAALCLQHDIPLLSNDRDMARVPGLQIVHW